MPTTLFTWKPAVECSVAQHSLESQPRYSAGYQLVNTEAISASHEAMRMVMVNQLSKFNSVLNYNSVMFLSFIMLLFCSVQGNACVVQSVA